MYIPKHFEQNDHKKSIAFMQAYNFAVVVSIKENIPIATHLPFIIEERNKDLVLIAHLSRANEQWKTFAGQDVLVIFSEPHAYISPSLYERQQNVPTWNYVAVHAYGKVSIINEPEKEIELLEKMMVAFDAAYLEQWKTLDPGYKENLRKGIVAFEIIVHDLQGKEKLSQNKTQSERVNIAHHLEETGDQLKIALAKLMKE
ncbi:MAG: FMN-binding negative transcriptional regulator [Bacteroidota bacterium]|nr:FMN-binding negative transcriptional regulator [Bacteroidota bacterium]